MRRQKETCSTQKIGELATAGTMKFTLSSQCLFSSSAGGQCGMASFICSFVALPITENQ